MVERRIKTKVDTSFQNFKDTMREQINNEFTIIEQHIKDNPSEQDLCITLLNDIKKKLIQEIYNYQTLSLSDEDFKKRKRLKNSITLQDRCSALKANKMQCSRRKLGDNCFCGTHLKGQPHGIIDHKESNTKVSKNVQVWAEEIKGIWYYIDDLNNVYDTNDILANITDPKKIAKYETSICSKSGNTIYTIPEYNI
tara:strand:+ start:781 stop:1368 length:588 start_codon:yes stop_codon:yes gene_type:complete